jgi:hypothetical protein
MLYAPRDRSVQEQPARVVDGARLLEATTLALEDIPIYSTLEAMLIVRECIEVKADLVFPKAITQALWKEVLEKALAVMGMWAWEKATRRRQCGWKCSIKSLRGE